MRAIALVALVLALSALAFGQAVRGGGGPHSAAGRASADALATGKRMSLPLAADAVVSRTVGRATPTYWAHDTHGSFRFANTVQRFRAHLSGGGLVVRAKGGEVGLRLLGVGSRALPRGIAARSDRNRVVIQHGAVSEWFANGPLGLEQGLTLRKSAAASSSQALTLTFALSGNLRPRLVAGAIVFSGGHGALFRYGDLVVKDASGRQLPARFVLGARRLSIQIRTARARFPLQVDPLVQSGSKLTEPTSVFGVAVAVSADGTTALVGGNPGAWVFSRTGSTWAAQAQLSPSGPTLILGASVALSSDGNTALVGDPGEGTGTVWAFTRTGTNWSQQGPGLTGNDATSGATFGSSLAVSADGNTALIGGHFDNSGHGGDAWTGAAWVFGRSGSTWTQQGPKLVPSDETVSEGEFGQSVALSANGTVALVGGPSEANAGAAWVFTGTGSSWAQSAKLTPSDEIGHGQFGQSVALSGDGTTALIGGPDDNAFAGAVWVFANSGSGFVQQGAKLTASGESIDGRFGSSVAISSDGSTALVGGFTDNGGDNNAGNVGAAWVFTNPGSGWSQQGSKLTPSDESGAGSFGFSVALSGNGAVAFIGGYTDNSFTGAAWAFGDSRAQTISFTSTNPSPVSVGGATYTPAATSSSGLAVTITLDAASSGCTLSGGVVTFTAAGTCLVDANQAGDATHDPAPQVQQSLTVTSGTTFVADPSIADTSTPSACTSSCALRAAVTAAEAAPASQVTVRLLPGTFDLTLGALVVSPRAAQTITVTGTGSSADATVVNQTGNAGALIVGNSSSAGPVDVSLLEVTGGQASVGAGIRVTAGSSLTLDNSVVTGNQASFSGGGIDTNGTLVIENSSIVDNNVDGFGGGIDNFSETAQGVTMENSTVARNAATGDGGAIYNGATLQISNSTIAGNTAGGHGAGIAGGGFTLSGSILANDTTFNGGAANCESTATVASGGYDLADDTSCGLSTGAHDQLGTNPGLATASGEPLLASNGGPTGTIALGATSPAIATELAGCPATDQRGVARTPGAGPCDEGAYQTDDTTAGHGVSSDATLSGLAFSAGAITPAFSSSGAAYTLNVPSGTSSTTLTATATSTSQTLSLSAPFAAALSSGVASAEIPLAVGQTAITVHVLAADGVTSNDYTVTVTRPKAAQSLQFTSTAPPAAQAGGPTYTPIAIATSGLTVAVTLDGASTGCTLTAGVVTFTSVGTCVLDANQPGNASFAAAVQVQQTIAVAAGPTGVTATVSGSSVLYAGLSSTYTLAVDNRSKTAVAPGGIYTVNVSNPYAVPTITASGDGWSCANVSAGPRLSTAGSTDVICTDESAIGAGASSRAIALSLTPNPTAAGTLDHAVLLSPTFSSAGETLSQPLPLPLDIKVPERASPSLAISGPATLGLVSTTYGISLANNGAGSTVGPSTVTLALPSGVTAHAGHGIGWHCGAPTATTLTCSESQALGPRVSAAKLLVALTGTRGSADTVPLTATASTNDLGGSLGATATLPVSLPVQMPAPALQFAQQSAPVTDPTDEARYTLQVSNQGGGPGAVPLTVTEQLPPGLSVQTAGTGWSCSQATDGGGAAAPSALTLSCSYAAGTQLAAGAQTGPLGVTLTGTNVFAGGAVPLTTTVALDAVDGTPEGTSANEALGIPQLSAAATSAILTSPSSTVSPGGTEQLTFGLANYSGSGAAGPTQIALALPAGMTVASLGVPTHDDPLPVAGSSRRGTPFVGFGPTTSMSCASTTSAVTCSVPRMTPSSETTVTVSVAVSLQLMGDPTLTGGIVQVSPFDGDVAALADTATVKLHVVTFTPAAGGNQTLPVGSFPQAGPATGGVFTPTLVNLDGSQTRDVGSPLSFAWVQIAGPPVTWAAGSQEQDPNAASSSLPRFQDGAFTSTQVTYSVGLPSSHGSSAGTPTFTTTTVTPGAYGARASFSYPGGGALTVPTVFAFELYATDGGVVHTATTSVTLDPVPPAPPVAPEMCMWDISRTGTAFSSANCLESNGLEPKAGDVVAAGSVARYDHDTVGDPIVYSWTIPGGIFAKVGCSGQFPRPGSVCFVWPAQSTMTLTAALTNGRTDAHGNAEQAVVTVRAGHSPPPLTVAISGLAQPVPAGTPVQLTAVASSAGSVTPPPTCAGATTSGCVTYSWTQASPAVAGAPQATGLSANGNALTFVPPAPTSTGSTVTFDVTAAYGTGAAAAIATSSFSVSLLAPPPLAVTVTPTPASSGGIALAAHASGGGGGPYTFTWNVPGSLGTVAESTSDAANATFTPASGALGAQTLALTVQSAIGKSTSLSVPVTIGTIPSFPSGSTGSSGASTPAGCPSGLSGPLAFILGQLETQAPASLTLGPVTLNVGSVINPPADVCSAWSASPTLKLQAGTLTLGPLTLSAVDATLTKSALTITSATVSLPSGWNLGTGSVSASHPVVISFDGSAPRGTVTWTGTVPFLSSGGFLSSSSPVATTITLGAQSLSVTAAGALSDSLGGEHVNLTATLPLGSQTASCGQGANAIANAAICADITVGATGKALDGHGTVAVGSDGTITPDVTLTLDLTKLPHPITIPGVTLGATTLAWDETGLTLAGSASVGSGSHPITLAFDGSFSDPSNWSAAVSLTSTGTPGWLPTGVSLNGASATGTIDDEAGTVSFDVKLSLGHPWTFTPSGWSTPLASIDSLTAEISNSPAPSPTCDALAIPSGSVWVNLAGAASITLPKVSQPVTVAADACVDPGSSGSPAFVLTTRGFDGWTPFNGVTVNGVALTVTLDASQNLTVEAAGSISLGGVDVTLNLEVTNAIDGSPELVAIGSVQNLQSLGLPLAGVAGAALYSTVSVAPTALPASLLTGTGITPSDLIGLPDLGPDSVTLLAAFPLGTVQCLLDETIYDNPCTGGSPPSGNGKPSAPDAVVVSAQIGAGIPTITASLSAGPNGLQLFSIGSASANSQLALALRSIDLELALDGTISIGGEMGLTLPSPSGGSEATLDVAADVAIDPTGPSIALAATFSPPCDSAASSNPDSKSVLCNFLGVRGLDLGAVSVQLGINFATTPIPTPTFGFAAAIDAIPCSWAVAIGDQEATLPAGNGSGSTCQQNHTGVPDPGSKQAEPLSIAVNLADTAPIFALQLGLPNNSPVLQFGNALEVDDASFVVAPAGGTIGAGPNAVTYQPGTFSLAFDTKVAGVPLSVHAVVNPAQLSLKASASVGTINLGPVTIQNTMFNLDIEPLAPTFAVGFSGGVAIAGGPTLQASLAVAASTGSEPSFAFEATGGSIDLGGLALTNFKLSANGQLVSTGLPDLSLLGSAQASLLGTNGINLAGNLTISGGQVKAASFYANPTLSIGSGATRATLTGTGCGPSAPEGVSQTSGACLAVSYGSGTLAVSLNATASVSGIAVTFDGTLGPDGLAISDASASVVDPLDPRADSQTIGSLSGMLYTHADPSVSVTDPVSGTSASPQSGDFVLDAQGVTLTLGGVVVNGGFGIGVVGDNAWAYGNLNVDVLSVDVPITGEFSLDPTNGLEYALKAGPVDDRHGGPIELDNFAIDNATLELCSAAGVGPCTAPGLSVSGSFDGPDTQATVAGTIGFDRDGNPVFYVTGRGALDVAGASLSGSATIGNETAPGGNPTTPFASFQLDGSLPWGGGISFAGSAELTADGGVCDLNGSLHAPLGFTASVAFCDTGAQPGVAVTLSDGTYTATGMASSPSNWKVDVQVASGTPAFDTGCVGACFNNNKSCLALCVEASAGFSYALDIDADSNGNFGFSVNGSGTISGKIWGVGTASGQVALSGTQRRVCAESSLLSNTFGISVGLEDGSGINADEPNPPFGGSGC